MAATQVTKDPVCGMEVNPLTVTETSEHDGNVYYFCSPKCKQDFDHAPQLYTAASVINPAAP